MKIKPPRGIYIHVPLCVSKCAYCSFYSLPEQSNDVRIKYITQLCHEITQTAKCFNQTGGNLRTIYLGGGTPSVLGVEGLEEIAQAVGDSFGLALGEFEEATIEVNPATVDVKKLKSLRDMGFNRVSIGVQSLNDNLLKAMGRPHSAEEAVRALDDACRAGFENISGDLIFGLPGQTLKDVGDTIDGMLACPSLRHVSAYSLSIEEGTRFERLLEQGRIRLPDEDLEREMQYLVEDRLAEAGMRRYEISNFALPGFESRHNTLYWTLDGYFGFGPGAASFLNGVRTENDPDLDTYIENSLSLGRNSHRLSESEAKGDFMLLGLRLLDGVRDSDYRELFGSSFFDDYGREISSLIKRSLLVRSGESIRLTPLGTDLANQVFMEFV